MLPILFRIPEWVPIVGDEAITSFGALLLMAFLLGGTLFVRRLRGHRPDAVGWDLVVTGAVAGIVGAKLLHLAVHGLLGLPSGGFGRGGLDWFGGLAAGAAAVLWHARSQGFATGAILGAAAAPLALGYAIGRIGSFLVGADYGLPTTLPWGVSFPAGAPPTTPANLMAEFGVTVPAGARTGTLGDFVRVHPTQLYEAALSLGIFGILLRAESRRNGSRVSGPRIFGLYLVLGGVARALVELVRVKPDRLFGPVTLDLILALAAIAVGVALRTHREHNVQPSEVA